MKKKEKPKQSIKQASHATPDFAGIQQQDHIRLLQLNLVLLTLDSTIRTSSSSSQP
jgi:hypothetical protein